MKCELCRNKGYYRNALDNDTWCGCSYGRAKEIEQIERQIDRSKVKIAELESQICSLRTRLVEKKNAT